MMADVSAWDYGPGDQSSGSLSFAEMLSGGSQALSAIIGASNDVKKALGSSSVTTNSRTDSANTGGKIPAWLWLVGAVVLYKAAKS